jgi:hypothetical protein
MRARTVVWRARCARLAAVALALPLGCGPTEQPPFRPLADNKLLMQAVLEPQAEVIWDAVQTIITEQGTEEIRPRTDEEWASVRNSAITLAEAGNLLMMSPRAKDGGDWMQAAAALIDTSSAAMQAAEARDADRLFEVGGEIYGACTACHQKFWPPPPGAAPL